MLRTSINAEHAVLQMLLKRVTWNAVGYRRPGLHQPNSLIGSRLDDISPGGVIEQDLVLILSTSYVSVLPESCPCTCHSTCSCARLHSAVLNILFLSSCILHSIEA